MILQKYRYCYRTDKEIIYGDEDQIVEYVGKSEAWLRQHGMKKLNDRNVIYELMDWDTEQITEMSYKELAEKWPVKDIRRYSQSLYNGCVIRKLKMSIVGIRSKPLEVVRL